MGVGKSGCGCALLCCTSCGKLGFGFSMGFFFSCFFYKGERFSIFSVALVGYAWVGGLYLRARQILRVEVYEFL